MKVIFLDFDGVLNSEKYVRGKEGLVLDPQCMARLKKIVDATRACIVLTTSWREHWQQNALGTQMDVIFGEYGLKIYDKTPLTPGQRPDQIKAWLDAHPETRGYVVLDDRLMYADFLKGRMVKTSNYYDGLDEEDTQRAIRILNEEN